MNRFQITTGSLAIVLIAGSVLFLSGCKRHEEHTPPPPPPQATPAQPKYTVKVVPRPDTTDELQRVYSYLPDGTLAKLEIQYRRNGRTVVELYRKDGSVTEVQEMHPFTTSIKSSTRFDQDGKTKIEETTFRLQGGLDAVTEFHADGSATTKRYRSDGKRLLAETNKEISGKKTSTFYHQDGKTLWAKTVEETNGDSRVETFRQDGTRDQDREVSYDRMVITIHGADGKTTYRQTWSGYRYSYYRNYSLDKVEEYEADGVTVKRTLEFERYGNRNLSKATDMKNGKPAKIRYFRYYDGTLEREEIIQPDGTSKVENHEASEGLTEKVDPSIKLEPKFDDPLVDSPSHLN